MITNVVSVNHAKQFEEIEGVDSKRRFQIEWKFHNLASKEMKSLTREAFLELARAAKISKQDLYYISWGGNPLFDSIRAENFAVLQCIVDNAGRDILNRRNHIDGVFSVARTPRMVEKLIELGADVNLLEEHLWSPLREALNNEKFWLAECLIKHDAECFPPLEKNWTWIHKDEAKKFMKLIAVQKAIKDSATLLLSLKDHGSTLASMGVSRDLISTIFLFSLKLAQL